MAKKELNLDKAFRHFSTYLPVAFDFSRRDGRNALKLCKRVDAVIGGKPIDDVVAILAMLLGEAINQWHEKQQRRERRRRQRKAAA